MTLIASALLAVCGDVLFAATAVAQPDFSTSAITLTPATVVEGGVVTMQVALRNSGIEDAPYAEMILGLPLEALLVEYGGLDGAQLDPADRTITATVDLPAGSERLLTVTMVVPRDAGGNTFLPELVLRYPYRQVEFRTGEPVTIETRAGSSGGLALPGGWEITPAGLAVLIVVALYPLLWSGLPRRRRSHGPVFAIVVSIGFPAMFAVMAKHDWDVLTRWTVTDCLITDKRFRIESSTSTVGRGTTLRNRQARAYKSLLALRYDANGQQTISTGYDTGTRLSIGRGQQEAAEYERWMPGETVPCWFDPDDPGDVVVIRGFGGAYAFAGIPAALLTLGVAGVWRRRGR
jgi:hypothetical protein